jgi:hypothetical protein
VDADPWDVNPGWARPAPCPRCDATRRQLDALQTDYDRLLERANKITSYSNALLDRLENLTGPDVIAAVETISQNADRNTQIAATHLRAILGKARGGL